MTSTYKELIQLKRQSGKYFNNCEKLTPDEIAQMKRLNLHITITRADLLRQEFERQNKIKQVIQDKGGSNIMNLLSRGE